jgi:TRAP-type C4-dicarboxylate transport system permease small subunit
MNKIGLVLLAGMLALLAFAIVYAWRIWVRLSNVDMGVHGWTAMILGIVLSTALGVGLMFLIFYSNRKGFDRIERD